MSTAREYQEAIEKLEKMRALINTMGRDILASAVMLSNGSRYRFVKNKFEEFSELLDHVKGQLLHAAYEDGELRFSEPEPRTYQQLELFND